jgi:RNA-directed DNA polymerase
MQRWELTPYQRHQRRQAGLGNFRLVRFADDFVVVSNAGIAEVKAVKQDIKDFLATELHLELSEEKTHITHVNDGFTFLGFHIQRVWSEGHWAVHLRPADKAKQRVKEKIKSLTTRTWTWMDEYTRLTTLNAIGRGWANYYRYTSLVQDIEDITRYTWHRYLKWLLNKHKGSRKHQLIASKTKVIHGRTRWTAQIREGKHQLFAYQWLPTRKELPRRKYPQKGKEGFPHPYLDTALLAQDYPQDHRGPDESLYTLRIGVPAPNPSRQEPLEMVERKLRAKMRDHFRCVQCGATAHLHVHHTKGTKSHRLADLETLCLQCHQARHGLANKYHSHGKPRCGQSRTSGLERGMGKTPWSNP